MTRDEHVIPGNKSLMNMNETLRYYFLSFWVDILQHFFETVGWERRLTLSLSSCSNDDIEEGDPGSDSDFEIDTKKEVNSRKLHLLYINVILHSLSCCSCKKKKSICLSLFVISLSTQAVKQNPNNANTDKTMPSRSGPVKKENFGAQYRHHPLRARRRPPKGMYLEQGDITSLSASHDAGVLTVRQLDTQLVSLKRQVCTSRISKCTTTMSLTVYLSVKVNI